MKKYAVLAVCTFVMIVCAAKPAASQDWGPITVHVGTILNTQRAPLSFDFTTDNTPSTCNGYIFYFANGTDEATQIANGHAVLAVLMAAQLTGHTVSIVGNNPSGSLGYCKVMFIQLEWPVMLLGMQQHTSAPLSIRRRGPSPQAHFCQNSVERSRAA